MRGRLLFKLPIVLQVAASVPRGCREGRANELLSITIERIIPGVGLDNELLSSQAKATPENDGQ